MTAASNHDPVKRRRHRNERIAAAVIVLLLAAAALTVRHFNRQEADDLLKQSGYVPKQTTMTPELQLLQQYIRINTTNPPGNELPAAEWLAGLISATGVRPEIIQSAPGRASIYARIKGKRNGEGLLLLHHIDVVAADPANWKRPPFNADVYLNQLYGRGAIDMKGMAICHLRAFLDVARSQRPPERDLIFLGVADEEAGSNFGMRWLNDHRPDLFEGVRYAINEGGITEMIQERVTYFGIEVGTKQTVTVLLQAPTRDQLQQARIALEPWFLSGDAERVLPQVRDFFSDLAPQRQEYRKDLADIHRTIDEGRFWRLPIGYRELLQNTVWAEAITPAAGRFQMRTQLLSLPDEEPDSRIAWLREKVRPYGATIGKVLSKAGPAPISSDRTPFYALIKEEAERAFGSPPVGTEILNRWFNDSRFLRQRGIQAYGLNTFPIDFFEANSIHGVDERIRVDYFTTGVEFTRRLVSRYVFAE